MRNISRTVIYLHGSVSSIHEVDGHPGNKISRWIWEDLQRLSPGSSVRDMRVEITFKVAH